MDLSRSARAPLSASLVMALVGIVHCGGATTAPIGGGPHSTGPDGGPDYTGDGAVPVPVPGPSPQPLPQPGPPGTTCTPTGGGTPVGRPQAIACARTPPFVGGPIIVPTACATNADCQDAGVYESTCLHGQCGEDQCLTDADCPSGTACGCANQFHGNALPMNRCVSVGCRVDADCGKGEVCSASTYPACGGFAGYYCHGKADTCATNADCCGDTPACAFDPTQGHWSCAAVQVCAG